jgi:hypothetical protein
MKTNVKFDPGSRGIPSMAVLWFHDSVGWQLDDARRNRKRFGRLHNFQSAVSNIDPRDSQHRVVKSNKITVTVVP